MKISEVHLNELRFFYLVACFVTMGLGLFSRSDFWASSEFVTLYAGDGLWALMVYWGVCTLIPKWTIKWQALLALLITFGIEFSQLYQAEWLNALRHTRLGGLILGFGFKISDLIAYSCGILIGILVNRFVLLKISQAT